MIKEFKEFILRGNVVDLAVGIIIGGAFGAIVNSLVTDIIMPPIGLILGKVNFTELFVSLDGQTYATLEIAKSAGAPTLNYGLFINAIVNFLIIALAIFLAIRTINRMIPKKEPAPEIPARTCPYCASEISEKATRCPFCTSQL